MNVGFIGIGHMGGAILKGYVATAKKNNNEIYAYDLDKEKLEKYKEKYGINICDSITKLISIVDTIIVGVRPKDAPSLYNSIKDVVRDDTYIISMAAGVKMSSIRENLGSKGKLMRIMPNIPAEVNAGVTSISREDGIDDKNFQEICGIFTGIGTVHEICEEQIHNVIGVSGSSPAYTFMYIEALAQSAEKRGMTRTQAVEFAAQAVMGAAKLVIETGTSPDVLKDQVCVEGGTTIEAIKVLEEKEFSKIIDEGYEAAYKRSIEMS